MLAASNGDDSMPAWMREDTGQKEQQQALQVKRLRQAKAHAKTTLFGASQHSPWKQQSKGAKGHAIAQARHPGSESTAPGESGQEDSEFLLEAWDSDAEEAAAKRKASR